MKKILIAVAVPLLGIVCYNSMAQVPGPEHCPEFCEASTRYNCIVFNTQTNAQYVCPLQQVKGTPPPVD